MKKNDDNIEEHFLSFDKSEIALESKKLTRLPYYKLEELKRQEEKKMKNPHKSKKKEEYTQNHAVQGHTAGKTIKKKKIILKKINEESATGNINVNSELKQKEEHLPVMNPIEDSTSYVAKSTSFNPNENLGDKLKQLKYSVNYEVKPQKMRLSRKQRKLQNPENSLWAFLSAEEKKNITNNANISSVSNTGMVANSNQNNETDNNNNSNANLNRASSSALQSVQVSGGAIAGASPLQNKGSDGIKLLGRKKKRINKYKKAVYRYRYMKKQFIYDNIVNRSQGESGSMAVCNEKQHEKEKHETKSVPVQAEEKQANQNEYFTEFMIQKKEETNPGTNYIQRSEKNLNPSSFSQTRNNSNYNSNANMLYNYYSSANCNSALNSPINYGNNYPYQYPYQYIPYMAQFPFSFPPQMYSNPYMMNYYPHANQHSKFFYENFPDSRHTQNIRPITTNLDKKQIKKKGAMISYDDSSKPERSNAQPTTDPNVKFIFEQTNYHPPTEDINDPLQEEFKNYLKSTYKMNVDLSKLNGKELNDFLKEHSDIKKINLVHLQKLFPPTFLNEYIRKYEGVQPSTNFNKKIIREYVDQILDKEVDKKFSDFIIKLREVYYKKLQSNPMKVKKRFVAGMREIEKYIRLDEAKCLFVVPNIEKVEGKNSLDDRIFQMFTQCKKKNIPIFFGLNKFKLGQISRKKLSCVSMLAFINVEGYEKEFRELLEFAQKFRERFYTKYYEQRELYNGNKFISLELFDKFNNKIATK